MTRTVARAISVTASLVLMAGLLSLCGCEDSALEEARQEARQAKATVSALELKIAKSEQQISDYKEELSIVRETRDELQKQVDQIVQERDQAIVLAQQAEQVVTHLSARASGQSTTTAALQKEIDELKVLVADQAALIEELQKNVSEGAMIEEASLGDPPPVVDPNGEL